MSNFFDKIKNLPWWLRIILVLVWMGIIFILSSIPSLQSGLPSAFDLIARKMAHVFVYFVLTGLVWYALDPTPMWKGAKLRTALIIVFLYAISDEYHQTFVPGRNGAPLDVLVDSIGMSIALLWLHFRK